MTVYIEAVIIDNFFITLLSALCSYRFLALKVSKWRCVVASIAGTVVAVFYPFITMPAILLLLIKLTLCLVLSLILYFRRYNLLKGAGAFLLITFFFGGVMFAIGLMILGNAERALREPVTNIPIGLIIAVALLGFFFAKKASVRIKKMSDAVNFISEIEITIFSKSIRIKGFLDTGNRLYDEKSGLPVIIISTNATLRLLDEEQIRQVFMQNGETLSKEAHYIDYTTLNQKNNRMLVLKPSEIRLYSDKCEHTIKDVMIGLSFIQFMDTLGYDAILPPSILKKIHS